MKESKYYKVSHSKAKQLGFLSELVVLMNFGAIEEVEMLECFECGNTSDDTDDFILVNVEPADFSMVSPYPGYVGDLACKACCLPSEISSARP